MKDDEIEPELGSYIYYIGVCMVLTDLLPPSGMISLHSSPLKRIFGYHERSGGKIKSRKDSME